jgi:GTP:adenosylcobinamide-phosphate guanylyltransferase
VTPSLTRDIVIPAGGVISAEFAERIGSPYRALAPLGPNKTPVLQQIVDTLRAAHPNARVICVAPPEVAQVVQNVDLWLPSGDSGPENIRLGLSHAKPNQPALLCTSDLPLITPESVQTFIAACRSDALLTAGLVRADVYEREFQDAPPSQFVDLSETGPITLAGLFQIQPDLLVRQSALFDKLFQARKAPWHLAGLFGPRLLWQFATKTLNLHTLTQRAEQLLGGPVQIILETDPVLAYDIDTPDDYTYAATRFGT